MLILILLGGCFGVGCWVLLRWQERRKRHAMLQAHSIDAPELRRLMEDVGGPRVYDVRQPLDLLAHSEIIPGSERIAPKEILADPTLIAKDVDTVVYCTCPGDTTGEQIIGIALALDFRRIRILTGGFDAWKALGFPVERYTTAFHLDTPV